MHEPYTLSQNCVLVFPFDLNEFAENQGKLQKMAAVLAYFSLQFAYHERQLNWKVNYLEKKIERFF